MRWPTSLDKKIKSRVDLSAYTSFRIGGEARFFFEPRDLKELREALVFAGNKHIPVLVLGEGSNILVNDAGVEALVIKLAGKDFKDLRVNGTYLRAGCGLKLNRILSAAKERGLSGLEFLAGIPGTLGGALMGNAGAWGRSIGDLVEEVSVLDYNGKPKLLKKKQLEFGYRRSNLFKYIIIEAKLKLVQGEPREIAASANRFLREKKLRQGNNLPNAGCVFKNPMAAASGGQGINNLSAGKLIDACGLKGRSAGGAVISSLHANFILNKEKARSKDVLSLMRLARREVQKRFKITLEPEIRIWS